MTLHSSASPHNSAAQPGRAWGPLLSFVAGYVDTLGFVSVFGLFTAHVTGNFVLIGKELSGHGEGVLLKLLAFPVFVAAVACARLLSRALARKGRSAVKPLLFAQAALLLSFMALGLLASPITSPRGHLVLAAGLAGVAAMGVQNALSRLELGVLVPTTVMTGNVTQTVIDLVDLLHSRDRTEIATTQTRMVEMIPAIVGFGAGALGGAMAWKWLGFVALMLPISVLLGLGLHSWPRHAVALSTPPASHERKPG